MVRKSVAKILTNPTGLLRGLGLSLRCCYIVTSYGTSYCVDRSAVPRRFESLQCLHIQGEVRELLNPLALEMDI